MSEKICAIKIRSCIRANGRVRKALDTLGLARQNNCVILDKTPAILGTLKLCEGYITYGEVDKETMKKLMVRRAGLSEQEAEKFVGDFFDSKAKITDVYPKGILKLHPPRGGFERKGKKAPYNKGGATGDRGGEINKLLARMI